MIVEEGLGGEGDVGVFEAGGQVYFVAKHGVVAGFVGAGVADDDRGRW